jgi:hypothetical protein
VGEHDQQGRELRRGEHNLGQAAMAAHATEVGEGKVVTDITDADGRASWPFAYMNYVAVWRNWTTFDCTNSQEILGFLAWMLPAAGGAKGKRKAAAGKIDQCDEASSQTHECAQQRVRDCGFREAPPPT